MAAFTFPFGLLYPRRRKREGQEYGDVYTRTIASTIDLMLLFLLLRPFFRMVDYRVYKDSDPAMISHLQTAQSASEWFGMLISTGFARLWLIDAAIQFTLIGIFYVSVQVLCGTTPGKWLFGLRIVKAKSLAPVERWRYALRFLGYIPSAGSLVGVFLASFNRERRTLHDYIAGTVVINLRPEGWYWGKVKALYRRLRGRSAPVEEPVREPSAE